MVALSGGWLLSVFRFASCRWTCQNTAVGGMEVGVEDRGIPYWMVFKCIRGMETLSPIPQPEIMVASMTWGSAFLTSNSLLLQRCGGSRFLSSMTKASVLRLSWWSGNPYGSKELRNMMGVMKGVLWVRNSVHGLIGMEVSWKVVVDFGNKYVLVFEYFSFTQPV